MVGIVCWKSTSSMVEIQPIHPVGDAKSFLISLLTITTPVCLLRLWQTFQVIQSSSWITDIQLGNSSKSFEKGFKHLFHDVIVELSQQLCINKLDWVKWLNQWFAGSTYALNYTGDYNFYLFVCQAFGERGFVCHAIISPINSTNGLSMMFIGGQT